LSEAFFFTKTQEFLLQLTLELGIIKILTIDNFKGGEKMSESLLFLVSVFLMCAYIAVPLAIVGGVTYYFGKNQK